MNRKACSEFWTADKYSETRFSILDKGVALPYYMREYLRGFSDSLRGQTINEKVVYGGYWFGEFLYAGIRTQPGLVHWSARMEVTTWLSEATHVGLYWLGDTSKAWSEVSDKPQVEYKKSINH